MIAFDWTLPDATRCCFLCGADFHGHAGIRMTSARTRPDGTLAITQVAFCRGCFDTMRQRCAEAETPCVQYRKAA